MAFQPFGFPFDIRSQLTPDDLRQKIRARSKGWFDTTNGARGWAVGPAICLWFSAFDQQGPMLLGWISQDGRGTRITGRAGSDLNGLLLLVLLTPPMAFCVWRMASPDGDDSPGPAMFSGGVFALICVVVLWSKHLFRRDAEPLVRFLRDAARKSSRPHRSKATATTRFSGLALTVNGEDHEGEVTSDTIYDALLGLGPEGFAALASARENYIQTVWRDRGFIIEKRDGDGSRHFRAARSASPRGRKQPSQPFFTFEEVTAVFVAYASGRPTSELVVWEKMQ